MVPVPSFTSRSTRPRERLRQNLLAHGQWRDSIVYSILEKQMAAVFKNSDRTMITAGDDLAGIRGHWGDRFDPAANPDIDDLWRHYILQGAEIIVVELNNRIVGTGTLLLDSADAGRLARMSVHRAHRGRGLGHAIVADLAARARRRGLKQPPGDGYAVA